jgi:hypothetical protein
MLYKLLRRYMKFFRLDLLTLLISLFILNSCKNQDTIGLTPAATGQVTGVVLVDTNILTNTTTDDSLVTSSGVTKSPMGYFIDPAMGTTESDLVTDLNLPGSEPYTLPTGTITVDSAVLILKYADGFYGDSISSKYKVNVYQLNERAFVNKNYYNTKIWSYNADNLLGTRSFYARTHDSVKVTTIVSGGPDTLIKLQPQLRIPISPAFIKQILFNAPSNQINSNLVFLNTVKWLYITLDKTQTTGAGGIFMFAAPTADSLAVYFRATNGTTVDTVQTYLNIGQYASQITHNYSPAVKAAISNTTTSDKLIYLQGLASLRAKISFPYIGKLFSGASIGGAQNVVINRAELVLTPQPGSAIPAYLVPQPKLSLYRNDLANQRTSVEDASSLDPRHYDNADFGGFYIPTLGYNDYHFLVTSYVQDLALGKTIDYGTYIAPIDTTNTSAVDIAPTVGTAGRTVAVGNDPSSPYRIKLNIIYTKTNKQ